MNDLITVNEDTQTVSARDLHEALEIKERFSLWFSRFTDMFTEYEDYTSVGKPTEVQNNGGVQIRELEDYSISVEMAKHICMMSKTEKGKQCRQYFLNLEKAWNTPEQIMARALKVANTTIDKLKEHNILLEKDNISMKPKALFADAVTTSKTDILVRDLAKLITQNGFEIGEKRLHAWLRKHKYTFKATDGSIRPMQRYVEQGLFKLCESAVTTKVYDEFKDVTGEIVIRTNMATKVTGKGQQYFIEKFIGK